MTVSSYNLAPGEASDAASMRRKMAYALMQEGTDTSGVRHWAQGLAKLGQSALGGYELYKEDQKDEGEKTKAREMMATLLSGGGGATPAGPGAPMSLAPPDAAAPPVAAPGSTFAPQPGVADATVPLGSSRAADEQPQPQPGGPVPRGYRNGNPLNIEDGPFARSQPGYAGTDGRFARFASLDQGTGAAGKLLDVYQQKHGLNTVNGIIGRWAPAGDGNNVSAYAGNVASQLGIDPNAPLTPDMRQKLIAAMAKHENGQPLPGMSPGMPPAPTTGPATAALPQPSNPAPGPSGAGPAAAPPNVAPPAAAAGPGPALAGPSPQPMPGIDRDKLAAMLSNKYTAPMAQQVIAGLLAQQFKPNEYGFSDLPDGTVLRRDPRKGTVEPVYQAPSKPSYGVVGKDEFGNERYGWIDPYKKTAVENPLPGQGGQPAAPAAAALQPAVSPGSAAAGGPAAPGAPGAQPSTAAPAVIPKAPPGGDPKVFRQKMTEAAASDALPPEFTNVHKLRQEVQQLPSYKNIAQAAPIYKSMLDTAGTNSKASDLNLVYGLGKIFDPNSVVREGEMIMVKNTASLPDWLVGTANALNGGQALTPETRQAILAEAHNRVTSYKSMFDQDAAMYRGIAERNRMNHQDVIPDFGKFEPWAGPKAAAPGGAGGAPRIVTPEGAPTLRLDPATGKMVPAK